MSSPAGSVSAEEPRPGSTDVLVDLARIVQLVTDRPVEDIRPDRAIVADLRIDSLAMVEILAGAAQHFGVRIDDEDSKHFVRVGDLVDYIAARRSPSA